MKAYCYFTDINLDVETEDDDEDLSQGIYFYMIIVTICKHYMLCSNIIKQQVLKFVKSETPFWRGVFEKNQLVCSLMLQSSVLNYCIMFKYLTKSLMYMYMYIDKK